MAKPNYSHEKRQRDLARRKKNEEKRLRKLNRGTTPDPENPDAPPPAPDGTGDGGQQPPQ